MHHNFGNNLVPRLVRSSLVCIRQFYPPKSVIANEAKPLFWITEQLVNENQLKCLRNRMHFPLRASYTKFGSLWTFVVLDPVSIVLSASSDDFILGEPFPSCQVR